MSIQRVIFYENHIFELSFYSIMFELMPKLLRNCLCSGIQFGITDCKSDQQNQMLLPDSCNNDNKN